MPAIPWEWAWPITKRELTGRKRTRLQKWTHKLVLQVEVKCERSHFMSGERHPVEEFRWRDATHLDGIQL